MQRLTEERLKLTAKPNSYYLYWTDTEFYGVVFNKTSAYINVGLREIDKQLYTFIIGLCEDKIVNCDTYEYICLGKK